MEYLGILKLNEFSLNDVYSELPERYKNNKKEAQAAFEAYINYDLRYNAGKGTVRTKEGWISKYKYNNEKPCYTALNLHLILQDEFMPWINNSISQQLRGYPII